MLPFSYVSELVLFAEMTRTESSFYSFYSIDKYEENLHENKNEKKIG